MASLTRSSDTMVGYDQARLGYCSKSRKRATGGSCNWGKFLLDDERVVGASDDEVFSRL